MSLAFSDRYICRAGFKQTYQICPLDIQTRTRKADAHRGRLRAVERLWGVSNLSFPRPWHPSQS